MSSTTTLTTPQVTFLPPFLSSHTKAALALTCHVVVFFVLFFRIKWSLCCMKWLMKLGKNVTVLLVDVGFGVFLMTVFVLPV